MSMTHFGGAQREAVSMAPRGDTLHGHEKKVVRGPRYHAHRSCAGCRCPIARRYGNQHLLRSRVDVTLCRTWPVWPHLHCMCQASCTRTPTAAVHCSSASPKIGTSNRSLSPSSLFLFVNFSRLLRETGPSAPQRRQNPEVITSGDAGRLV